MRTQIMLVVLISSSVATLGPVQAQTPEQRGWAKLADDARARSYHMSTDDPAYYRAFPMARLVMLKWCAGPVQDRPSESECRAARAAGMAR